MSTSSVITDLKIQQQCHVTVSPYANRQFPLRQISQHKRLKANKKKHKNPRSIIATHTSTMPSSRHPQIVSYFSETHTTSHPQNKKKLTSPAMANRMPNVATSTSRHHDATEARIPAAEHATAQGPGTGFGRPAKAA